MEDREAEQALRQLPDDSGFPDPFDGMKTPGEKAAAVGQEYRMLYVGRGLYTVEQFVAEAEKHGVARAMPQRIVKTLKWGDPILLAQWLPDTEAQRATMLRQTTLTGETARVASFKRIGAARVFGHFRVTGLNFEGLKEMKDELTAALHVVEINVNGERVSRRCGGYSVGATYYVEDAIEEILAKAEPIQEMYRLKFKFFVAGSFEPLSEIILDPARFSRGIVKVQIEEYVLGDAPAEKTAHALNYLLDYTKRSYVKKEDESQP